MDEEKIKLIFEEIDEASEESLNDKPIPYNESKFKERYEEIKRKYGRTY